MEHNGKTVITREYPEVCTKGKERYYPINNETNNNLYAKYKELSEKDKKIKFAGRLGEYKYYDMDEIIEKALKLVYEELSDEK